MVLVVMRFRGNIVTESRLSQNLGAREAEGASTGFHASAAVGPGLQVTRSKTAYLRVIGTALLAMWILPLAS